jgi:prepilin-type N-terminal cleavage/methylation domain-containing protein
MRTAPRRYVSEAGFTLIELLGVVTVFAIVAGMAVPALKDMVDGMRLGQAAREVERELQTARLKAVTSSRPIRVRFNCPTSGKYRMVELIGTPTANKAEDTPLSRCQETAYPAGPTDNNPLTVPNHDGPTRELHPSVAFGAAQTLEFWPDGSVHSDPTGNPPTAGSSWPVLPGGGTAITLTKSGTIKTITVNGLGKIQLQ